MAAPAEARIIAEMRVRLVVTGRVQGVYFRASTHERGTALGLLGWVKNRADGGVELLAQGSDEAINAIVAWTMRGPSSARVERVTVTMEPEGDELSAFVVVR